MRSPDAEIHELAQELASISGFGPVAALQSLPLESTNRNFVVSGRRGDRCVLRVYRQQPPPHTALVRLRREHWAYELLASAGVPVPRVLASSERPEAVLLEFLEGDPLGTLAPDMAAPWRSAGQAFAGVHAIDGHTAALAGCEQVGIGEPTRSRGLYHYEEAVTNLERLAVSHGDLPVRSLQALVETARPLYECASLALCQYDAHLWQFLIVDDHGRWRCSAILDWEHADLDDPDWDLTQLDVFRFAPLGALPAAFFDGYGRRPHSPLYELYRLERVAWLLDAYALGAHWLSLSVPSAEAWLRELLSSPTQLGQKIESAL